MTAVFSWFCTLDQQLFRAPYGDGYVGSSANSTAAARLRQLVRNHNHIHIAW